MRAERLLRDGETAAAVEIMNRVLDETSDRDLAATVQSRLEQLERAQRRAKGEG
jgi:predicted negative regulator of RcsB-dependent stress response